MTDAPLEKLSLAQLQQAFLAELSGQPSEAFRAAVKDNTLAGKMDKARRIDIYVRNHVGARVNGLGNVYAVCQQILGEEVFYHLAADYVASFASAHWDLNFHGGDFDQFLQREIDRLATLAELFYLPDLARLEWAYHICYFAAANQPQTVNTQEPEQLRFVADTSLSLFSTPLPVFQIWHNNRQNKGDLPVEDDQAVYYYVVFRDEFIPQVYTLNEAQYLLISDCVDGKSLAELAELHGEAVSENIPLFIQQKWLVVASIEELVVDLTVEKV